MGVIRKRVRLFTLPAGLAILISAILFADGAIMPEIPVRVFSTMTALGGVVLAGLGIRESRKLKIAQLIVENSLLRFSTAVVHPLPAKTAALKGRKETEIHISCFGILFEGKIIKFNQGRIRLRAVAIGPDCISFTYGTEKRRENYRLLRPQLDPLKLEEIAEKIRFETGITVTVE